MPLNAYIQQYTLLISIAIITLVFSILIPRNVLYQHPIYSLCSIKKIQICVWKKFYKECNPRYLISAIYLIKGLDLICMLKLTPYGEPMRAHVFSHHHYSIQRKLHFFVEWRDYLPIALLSHCSLERTNYNCSKLTRYLTLSSPVRIH